MGEGGEGEGSEGEGVEGEIEAVGEVGGCGHEVNTVGARTAVVLPSEELGELDKAEEEVDVAFGEDEEDEEEGRAAITSSPDE